MTTERENESMVDSHDWKVTDVSRWTSLEAHRKATPHAVTVRSKCATLPAADGHAIHFFASAIRADLFAVRMTPWGYVAEHA